MQNETYNHVFSFFPIFLARAPMSQCNICLVQQTVQVSWLVLITGNSGKNPLILIYIFSMKPEPIDMNCCQKITYLNRTMKQMFTLFLGAHLTNGTQQQNRFSHMKLCTK